MRVFAPKENFRIIVTPVTRWTAKPETMERDCEEIVRSIKRHVDDIEAAHILFDQPPVCSYCGARWTEESTKYNGGCCAQDEANAEPDEPEA